MRGEAARTIGSALVIGLGSMGMRRSRALRELGVARVIGLEPDLSRVLPAMRDPGVEPATSLEDALAAKPGVVFVCTPPAGHIAPALAALRAGCDIFMEKPLSDSLESVSAFEMQAAQRGAIVQVGYSLRFDPALRWISEQVRSGAIGVVHWARFEFGQHLADWRPGRDHRETYTAQRALGGGILLDGSHELDYAMWLLGEPREVQAMTGMVGDLDIDVEDCVTVLMRMQRGAQVCVHMDMLQRRYHRSCHIAGSEGTIRWNEDEGVVHVQRPRPEEDCAVSLPTDVEAMYAAEVEHFLACVQLRRPPCCGIAEGRRVLEVIDRIQRGGRSVMEPAWAGASV